MSILPLSEYAKISRAQSLPETMINPLSFSMLMI